ncbi:PAS domain S-box protein [Bradyrhizobium sp. WD16]|uniref:PAS domain S-box protein n=1 Tax=Bradyrhizobium sp. WD16 TaxID=1521768 RepID=UPI0020A33E9C|nr:PAS domain S-box protein [Bradyrhizobium sp. WD16]
MLILEDSPADAELMERTLRKDGLAIATRRVETRETFTAALDEFKPDIVLADFKLPNFDGFSALILAHEKSPDLPLIIVTGVLNDEAAVDLIKSGANDYVLKDRLSRLSSAVSRALSEAANAAALRKQKEATRAAEARLGAIANYAHDAIITMDSEGVVTFWNPAAERIFGYSSAEAVGSHLHRLVAAPGDLPYVVHGLADFAKTGTGPMVGTPREVTALKKGGTPFRVELSISAVKLDGKWSSIGVVRDLQERPKLIQL